MALFQHKLTRSVRCHIRRAKAEIRRNTENLGEQKRLIVELYRKFGVDLQ